MQKVMIIIYLLYFLLSFLTKNEPAIDFLDVDFGDSILITTPNGKTILIDGGGNYEILEYLGETMPPGFCHLDALVLTHPHADHLVGLFGVLDYCAVDLVISNDVYYDSALYDHWKDVIEGLNIKVSSIYRGESFYLDDMEFFALWPPRDYRDDNVNNMSIVILMQFQSFEVLLTGDIEAKVLDYLSTKNILASTNDGILEVVKIPHHGSSTAMLEDFYEALIPKVCVVSVGDNNYDLPSEDFLDFLDSIDCEVRRTDFEGTIRVVYNLII